MEITKEHIIKAAHLSRIQVCDQDIERFRTEMSSLLQWIEMLNEVDTENVDPTFSVNIQQLPLREDIVTEGNQEQDILRNSPSAKHNMFIVPKVVE